MVVLLQMIMHKYKVMIVSHAWMTASVGLLDVCRCNEKADIFSYGIVLWEIITQETPQRGTLRDIQVHMFSIVFCSFLHTPLIYWSFSGHILTAADVHCRDVVLLTRLQRCSGVDGMPIIGSSWWFCCAVQMHGAVVHFMCLLAACLSWSPVDLHLVVHSVMCHSSGSSPGSGT